MKRVLQTQLIICFLFAHLTVYATDTTFTLRDAYQSALRTNEIVKITEENVVQSQSRLDQALTYLYPRLEARSAYTRFNEVLGTAPFIFQPQEQFQAALVLRQPLYTGGRTFAALRTAETLRDMSSSNLTSTKQDILLNVGQAFYGVIKAQKLVDVSRRAVERMERHKKVTEREASTRRTKANMSALLRARTQVSQAEINLLRAVDGLKIAREQLSLITRLPVDAVLVEHGASEPFQESYDQLKKTAFANRADFESTRLNQKVAEENIILVRGGHYPQVLAEGSLQYQASSPETAFDGTTFYGGIRLQIPLFEGGLMKAEISEARSKLRQSQLSVSRLQRSIESEVHNAYINVQTINAVLETAKLQWGYAKDNFDAVVGLYGEGLASSLSMIDAEQALSQAERELLNATYDRELAILRLKKIIGVLGKNELVQNGGNHASS